MTGNRLCSLLLPLLKSCKEKQVNCPIHLHIGTTKKSSLQNVVIEEIINALLSACCDMFLLISCLIQQVIFKLQILGTDVVYTFEHPISGQQEAEIFDPVVVNPEVVLFPWFPLAPHSMATHNQFQYLLEVIKLLGVTSSTSILQYLINCNHNVGGSHI